MGETGVFLSGYTYAIYGRRYLYKRIYYKNKFKDYYEKYNNELKNFIAENKVNIIGKS